MVLIASWDSETIVIAQSEQQELVTTLLVTFPDPQVGFRLSWSSLSSPPSRFVGRFKGVHGGPSQVP